MDTTGGGGCFAESIDDDRCYDLRDSHTHIITSLLRHRQSFDEDRERIYSIGVPSVCVPRATCHVPLFHELILSLSSSTMYRMIPNFVLYYSYQLLTANHQLFLTNLQYKS